MKEAQIEIAIEMVTKELNRMAMCKRGKINTEVNAKAERLSNQALKLKEPTLTRKELTAVFAKNRAKMEAIPKLRANSKLEYDTSRQDIFTHQSITNLQKFIKEVSTHPDHPAYAKERKRLERLAYGICPIEIDQRVALLDYELKDINLKLVTGELKMRDFTQILSDFEAKEY